MFIISTPPSQLVLPNLLSRPAVCSILLRSTWIRSAIQCIAPEIAEQLTKRLKSISAGRNNLLLPKVSLLAIGIPQTSLIFSKYRHTALKEASVVHLLTRFVLESCKVIGHVIIWPHHKVGNTGQDFQLKKRAQCCIMLWTWGLGMQMAHWTSLGPCYATVASCQKTTAKTEKNYFEAIHFVIVWALGLHILSIQLKIFITFPSAEKTFLYLFLQSSRPLFIMLRCLISS